MKKLLLILLVAVSFNVSAQSFSYQGTTPAIIPDNNTDINFAIPVSGLPGQANTSFGLSQICIDISHTWVSDLKISLASPDGNNIILSLHNGGAGSNYSGTCFRMDATQLLTSAFAPFPGNYIPDQSLNYLNNNQNPNGTWTLSIIDVFPTTQGTLNSVTISFTPNPPPDPAATLVCTTTNASGCFCKDTSLTNCDLLPDLIVSHVVIRDGWGESPGVLDLPNSIIDIGAGPVEMKPTGNCFCDTIPVPCTTSICPDGSQPKERVNQRIYHKNPNGQMTFWDRPAGNQSYHPAHGHVHAEEFCEFSLRVATANPDATTWPIIGQSLKQSYCMINMGTCNSIDSLCMSHGQVITDNMLPNLNLGTVTGCGSQGQGLFVGRYDTYSAGFGQYITVPNICNGTYYIVCIIDPFDHFLEEDETNNWVAVPVTLTQQPGAPLNASFTYSLQGLTAAFFNFATGVTRTWDFGDGSPLVTAPFPQHTFPGPGTYQVQLTVFNGTCASTSVQTITILPTSITDAPSGIFEASVYPNPSSQNFNLEYQLVSPSDVTIEILNTVGEKIKLVYDGQQLSGKHILEVKDLASGIYFVRINTNDKVIVLKLMKL